MSSVNTATPLGKGRQLLVMDYGENYSKICFSRMNFDGPAALTLKIEELNNHRYLFSPYTMLLF